MQPGYELFYALTGVGPSLAPFLIVAFLEPRAPCASSTEYPMYAGIVPVTEWSGTLPKTIGIRLQCELAAATALGINSPG